MTDRPDKNRQTKILAALEECAEAMTSMQDPRSVLKMISGKVGRTMEANDCSIILLEGP